MTVFMLCLFVQNMYLIHIDYDINLLQIVLTRMHDIDRESSREIIPLMHRPLKLKYPSWQKQILLLSTCVSVQFHALSVPLHCLRSLHVSNNFLPTIIQRNKINFLGMHPNRKAQQKYT